MIFLQVTLSKLKTSTRRFHILDHLFPKIPVFTFVISTVRFSNGRQLLVDFQLISATSLDFQVALNLGETALINIASMQNFLA